MRWPSAPRAAYAFRHLPHRYPFLFIDRVVVYVSAFSEASQLVAQASAQAVLQANQVNRDLQGAAVARDLWQPGAAIPVTRKNMSVQAVGF